MTSDSPRSTPSKGWKDHDQISRVVDLRGLSGSLWAILLLSLVANLLMLTGPLYMLQIYDRVLASRSLPTLIALTLLVCGLYAFYSFVEAWRSRMTARVGTVVDARISDRLFGEAVRLKLVNAGPVDPTRDGEVVRRFLSGPGPLAFLDLPWVPIYMAIVFAFHPLLGWLALFGAILILGLLLVQEFVSRGPETDSNGAARVRQRFAEDARLNAESVVGMGMMANLTLHWAAHSSRLASSLRTGSDQAAFFTSTTKGLRFFLQSAVLAVGAYLVIGDEASGGVMIAASIMTSRALAPIEQVVSHWRSLVAARQARARIRKVLSIPVPRAASTVLPLPMQTMTAKQLGAVLPGTNDVLISGITFELQRGQAVGIIGPSGAGKSTLARVLAGVWPASLGRLELDTADLSQYHPEQRGQIVGYLPQHVELLDGTIAENISRFKENPSSEEIIDAAKTADVHELITSLPEGYDTRVGGDSYRLSAGQKQRIALARAVYRWPFLVVLDEPNSNLDVDGDAALSRAIHSLRQSGSIVVVVAHRPSTLAAVDHVLSLDKGRQTGFGPKEEVLERVTKPNNVRKLVTR